MHMLMYTCSCHSQDNADGSPNSPSQTWLANPRKRYGKSSLAPADMPVAFPGPQGPYADDEAMSDLPSPRGRKGAAIRAAVRVLSPDSARGLDKSVYSVTEDQV